MPSPSTPSPAVHHLATVAPAIREREGRPPCPPLGDTIDTTSPQPRHRSASYQKGSASSCLSSCPPRPCPRPLFQVLRVGKSKRANETGRERTSAKDATDLSPVPRLSFCSVCCPHRPHHRQPFTTSPPLHTAIRERKGRPPCPPLGDTIDTTSPQPRHRSTSYQKGSASSCLSSCPPRPCPRPLFQVVRVGQSTKTSRRKRKRENKGEGCRRPIRPFLASLLSVALTVHSIARSSLPSSSAVPVILRPDLVRSLSSVRPSFFLFLVPRSPPCRLTAKPSLASHYLTRSHHRQGGKGSPRPVLVVIPSPPPRHRPATGTGGPLPASPSPSGRW